MSDGDKQRNLWHVHRKKMVIGEVLKPSHHGRLCCHAFNNVPVLFIYEANGTVGKNFFFV